MALQSLNPNLLFNQNSSIQFNQFNKTTQLIIENLRNPKNYKHQQTLTAKIEWLPVKHHLPCSTGRTKQIF